MKIINRKEFLDLPPGVVFAKYEPCVFSGLAIKESSYVSQEGYAGDFVVQGLGVEVECANSDDYVTQCNKAEKGEDVPLDFDCAGRDGLFENEQLFAVLSKEDVQKLIHRLQETL